MTRFLLLLSAGLVSLQAAGFQVPRYRLSPGTKLWHTSESETKNPRGVSHSSRLLEHQVLSDSGGVLRVLLRVVNQGYKIDAAGKRTDEPTETGWELFEMTPDGKLLRDQSTIDVDVFALFPPLPEDSAAAAGGWTQVDTSTSVRYVYSYRLDNKSLSDSLWLVDRAQSTPFDIVYGTPASEARVVIDTRRGLPLRRESRSVDTTRKSESRQTVKLDSVTRFDAARLQPRFRDLISYFDVRKAYDEEADKAVPEDTSGVADRRALALLQDAVQRTQDSTVIGLLSEDIKQHEQGSEYRLARARGRLQQLGKPAPAWELLDLAGEKHSLKDYRGKVLVLDWWYKDCPWCILAMPSLTEVAQRYAGRPVAILGMNVDKDAENARFTVEKCKPGYPSLLAGKELAKEYGVAGYPTLFIVDKQGKIADVHVGYAKDLAARLSRKLDALLEP